jgi:hypothetical protein
MTKNTHSLRLTAAGVLAAFLVVGCGTAGKRTASGAGAGGLAGAGLGALIGGKKGALIGAAIGGGGAAIWDQVTRRK